MRNKLLDRQIRQTDRKGGIYAQQGREDNWIQVQIIRAGQTIPQADKENGGKLSKDNLKTFINNNNNKLFSQQKETKCKIISNKFHVFVLH